MRPLSDQLAATLKRRLEASALIALLSVVIFTGVDHLWGALTPLVTVIRGTQIAVAAATWAFARRVRTWDAVADGSLVFILFLTVTAVITAILRDETGSLPVLVTMIVVITATFASWGLRRQLILGVVALGGIVANLMALGELPQAVPYPLLPIIVALGVSAWVAAETDRHARARHNAEAALRESEERFRTLAQHAPVPIWMSDRDGSLTHLNPAWGEIIAPNPSLARAFWRAVHRKDRERLLAEARAALVARRPFQGECRVITAGGDTRWLAIRGVPRFAANGRYEGHIGTAVDVTDSKAEARSLAAAHTAALEAGRLKSSFLATMSHEIRTPMHGIFGMTELALDTDNDAEREEFVRRARSCAKTLMTLLDEILDLSRIEAGKLDLLREPVDVDEVIENAVDTVAMAAAQKGLAMIADVTPDVPTTIESDGNRLRQVLTNLLANAVKFTEAGEVELRASVQGDALRFSVRDTGIGIPPSAHTAIFEPFTQAEQEVGHRFGGTGLGLAISKRLVTGMGGDITVDSTVGVGTTFEVSLPMRGPLGPSHGARFAGVVGLSVLLADASPARRGALRRMLEAYGCRARVVASIAEAEEVLRDGRNRGAEVDVALVDVDLGAGGPPLLPRLRAAADRPALEIVLLCPLRSGVRDGLEAMDCLVVTRPILPSTLLQALLSARGGLAATGS